MRIRRFTIASTLALTALLLACSSESTVAPSAQQSTTLSQVLSEMSLPSLAGTASLGPSVPVQSVGAPVPSTCSYSATLQSFTCPTVTASGLTITQSYTLLDAAGKPQSQFDPNTTAAVRVKSTISGAVSQSGSAMTINQQSDMTLSGLLTATHVMNGTSTMAMTGSVTTGTLTMPITSSGVMTMSNLVMPTSSSSGNAWPMSGTITEDFTSSVDTNGSSVTLHMTMTFNGTNKVAVVTTILGTVQHCTMDLSLGTMTCS